MGETSGVDRLSTDEKLNTLEQTLADMSNALVAYSGGVDSTFLLSAALEALGPERVLAVTASSPIVARRDLKRAQRIANQLGARHRVVPTHQLADPQFVDNPPERCYFCKRIIVARLAEVAREENLTCLIEGSNLDDKDEHRPGTRALREAGVRSPLTDAGLTKAEVRALSRHAGLPTWSQPAETCLATRIPHGRRVTQEALARVEAAEDLLRAMGFEQLRVRHHGVVARIEVAPAQIPRLAQLDVATRVVSRLKELGYAVVSLDLEGYRRESLEKVIESDRR